MIEKEKVLSDAPKVLNSDNNPWKVTVEDTSIIKKSIRDYLKQCGWKKAGLFG